VARLWAVTLLGLLVIGGLALLCGCGAAAPDGNGGDNGDGGTGATMPPEERQAGMGAADTAFLALPAGTSRPEQNQQLADTIATLPQFTRAETFGEGGSGGVIAEFADGQPYIIVNGARADTSVDAAAEGIVQARSGQRSGLPSGKKALLMRAMGAAFQDIRGDLSTMLTNAGYTPSQQQGTIENLAAVRRPDIFYFDTHGVYAKDWGGPGKDLAVAWTATPSPNAAYEPLCSGADPELVRMTALDSYSATGAAVNVGHYGITPAFLRNRGVTFATNSLVYMDCCFLDLGPFKTACTAAGASLYAGWTDEVKGGDASRAALFGFDRMLGADSGKPNKETPKQRPFDYQSVLTDIRNRGWDHSGAAVLNYSTGAGDCGMLAPSIQFITLYEAPFYGTAKTKMEIAGLFGNDPGESKRKVTIADTLVEVSEWAPDMVTCDIPNFGEGSVGDVVVTVNDHKSNKVPLTEWTIPFTYTRRYWGSLQDTFHVNVHIRADIHSWRDKPRETPTKPTVVPFNGMADMDGDWKSEGEGFWNNDSGETRYVWGGSGSLSGAQFQLNGEGASAIGFVNVQSMYIEIHPLGVAGMEKTVDLYTPDGTHYPTTQAPFVNQTPVFDEVVDTQVYIKIPMNSDFSIEADSRTARTSIDGSPLPDGESATMEWESAEASFTPDATVHASGLAPELEGPWLRPIH